MINPDYSDLFASLNTAEVRYLVVGAYAVAYHSVPRATKDLDVWVEPTRDNAERLTQALKRFGAPLANVSPADFFTEGTVFQIGVAPNRIDILTAIGGVGFGEAWSGRLSTSYGDQPIWVIGLEDLIRNKKAVGRHRDLADVEELERLLDPSSPEG